MTMYVQLFVLLLNLRYYTVTTSELSTICPYSKYCTEGPQLTENRQRSCCRPCYCSDQCELGGTCCPDKSRHNTTYTMYPCLTQKEIYYNYLNINKQAYGTVDKYRVVTACHTRSSVASMKNKTEGHVSRCLKAQSSEDLTFVTSKRSGVTYLNKHCAMCNGEPEYREWKLYWTLGQSDFQSISTVKERDQYIFTNGNVISMPSNEADFRKAFCDIDIIDKCNISGLWTFYEEDVHNKCGHTEHLYYTEGLFSISVYKNAYCYLCNMPTTTKLEHKCDNILNSTDKDLKSTFSSSFYALISLSPIVENSQSVPTDRLTGKSCNGKEVFDPFQERCVELFCPPGSMAANEKCEFIFKDVTGFTTEVLFRLQNGKDIIPSRNDKLEPLLYDLISHVNRFVNNKTANCTFCEAFLYALPDDEFVFIIVFVSSPYCSHIHYLDRISKLFKKGTFPVNSKSLKTSVDLKGIYDDGTVLNDALFFVPVGYFTFCMHGRYMYSATTVHCPSVNILESDIHALNISTEYKNEIVMSSNKLGNDTMRLCLSEYQRIFALASISSTHACLYYVICMTIMMFVFLSSF